MDSNEKKEDSSSGSNEFETVDVIERIPITSNLPKVSLQIDSDEESEQVYKPTTHPLHRIPPIEKPPRSNPDVFDQLFSKFGKWQLRSILLVFMYKIPAAWFMHCILFIAPPPRYGQYFCQPPVNMTNVDVWIDIAHPPVEEVPGRRDFCKVYKDAHLRAEYYLNPNGSSLYKNFSDSLVPCYSFQHKDEYESLVSEFDLVCSREILIATSQFCHLCGVAIGSFLAIYLLNFVSPKKIALGGMSCMLIFGPLTGIADRYELHIIFRCLAAICVASMVQSAGVIAQDITTGKYKTLVTALHEQFWSIGVVLLPGLTFFFTSWTYLYFAMSAPALILLLLYRFVPDSPRWHADRGHVHRAMKVINKYLDVDKKQNDEEFQRELRDKLIDHATKMEKKDPPQSFCKQIYNLWSGPWIEKRNLICVHLTFSLSIVCFFGMLLNAKSFGRDRLQINTMLMGIGEICGNFIGTYLIMTKGRLKWRYTGVFNIIAAIISFCAWLVPPAMWEQQKIALWIYIAFIPKMAISSTFAIANTCSNEVVGAEKKKICGLSAMSMARIFALSTPYWGALGMFGQLIPQAAFATLGTLHGIASLLVNIP